MSKGLKRKSTPAVVRDLPNDWRQMRVVVSVPMEDLEKGQRSIKEFHGELGKTYNLRDAYERAHALNDPYLSPHGFFRRLAHGNNRHAREFLEEFGPLNLSAGRRVLLGDHVGVSLEQFWHAHARFCLVVELWENLDDRTRLCATLLEAYRHRDDISELEPLPIGTGLAPPPSSEPQPYRFPWDRKKQQSEEWLRQASLTDLRECSLDLIKRELDLHIRNRRIVWQRIGNGRKEGWRPVLWVESLSSAMWEFWGWDTTGVSWRRCPHCQRLFYPKRRDQSYCTPRQQALASKREYARWLRARQKREKKVQKRESTKNRKEPQR